MSQSILVKNEIIQFWYGFSLTDHMNICNMEMSKGLRPLAGAEVINVINYTHFGN